MKQKFFFIFFILTLVMSVSSCSEGTDLNTEISVEEYQPGGEYSGKLIQSETDKKYKL